MLMFRNGLGYINFAFKVLNGNICNIVAELRSLSVICLSFYVLFLILFYLCAIAIRSYDRKSQINTYLLPYLSYILGKYDKVRSSNPGDYELTNLNVWDKNQHCPRISQKIFNRCSPKFQC